MALTIDELQVIVDASVDDAIKGLKKTQNESDNTQKSFLNMAKKIAGPAVAGAIIATLVRVGNESSKAASRAEEIQSKFNVVFGETAKDINSWANTYSEAVGRSASDTKNFLGTIGDTLKPLGFAKDAVDDMSKQVVSLAGDLGSFNNIPTEEVITGIQSALVGNVETLRRYGVVANQAAIEQEALNSGISETGKNLTAQQKAQAILNITLKGTQDAHNDLLNTQDSTANTMVRLQSATKDLKIELGKSINEGITPMAGATATLVTKFSDWLAKSREVKEAIEEIGTSGVSGLTDIEVLQGSINSLLTKNAQLQSGVNQVAASRARLSEEQIDIIRKQRQEQIDANNELIQQARDQITNLQLTARAQAMYGDQLSELAEEEKRIADQRAAAAEDEAKLVAQRIADTQLRQQLQEELGNAFLKIDEQVKAGLIEGNGEIEKQTALRKALGELIDNNFTAEGVGFQRVLAYAEERGVLLEDQLTAEQLAADERLRLSLMEEEAIKERDQRIADEQERLRNERLEKEKALAQALVGLTSSYLSAIDSLADNFAAAELDRLKKSGASEEELANKKKEIAEANARREKTIALVNIGINTATAIVKGFADLGPIGGGIFAGAMGTLSAVQAAAVLSQPTAFAAGGDFVTDGPQMILVGDNPGGKERVSITPESSANINGPQGGGGGDVYLDGDKVGVWLESKVSNGTRNGSIEIFEGAITQ